VADADTRKTTGVDEKAGMKKLVILSIKEHTKQGVGDSHSMVNQMRALNQRGHRHVLLTGWTDMEEELREIGVSVVLGSVDNGAKGLVSGTRGVSAIRRVARNERVDVIHSHHRWPGLLGWAASRTLRLPIVHTDHTVLRGMKSLSYRGEAAISGSLDGAKHLEHYFRVPRENIEVVLPFHAPPAPGTPDAIATLRDQLGIAKTDLCIGRLASLTPVKSPDLMLEAYSRVRSAYPAVQLVMAGTGPLLADLRLQARRLGIEDTVHWLGLRTDISTVLGLLDLFVMSSSYEAASLAIMEAMTLGVPVVSTAVGGVPALLGDGRYGTLVPYGDADVLADAVVGSLADPLRRRAISEVAVERVRTHCAPSVLAERIETVYHRVCAERSAPWR
jgi:glycosyltransferase involved in cell wall biosynthesis